MLYYKRWRIVLQIIFYTIYTVCGEEVVCKSVEISKVHDFDQLRNCTLVVGYVRITNIQFSPSSLISNLTSQVREITDYLLVYRIQGLETLDTIFPNLEIIRGHKLLFDQYSLIVYENRNLLKLALFNLMRIQKGDVRVENNPNLCFLSTLNWAYLLGNSSKQHYYLLKNKSPDHCLTCTPSNKVFPTDQLISKYCWDLVHFQQMPTPVKVSDCPRRCALLGCNEKSICCNRNCVSDCNVSGCRLCANFKDLDKCVDFCIARFELFNHECIHYDDCRKLGMIPYGSKCIEKCPSNHIQVNGANGTHCKVNCTGLFVIHHAKDLDSIKDCSTINGSLSIELKEIETKIISEFETAFVGLKEITGYLKIKQSPQLVSLTFLSNLDTIRGEQLIENKYALMVVNNHHLEQIWDTNQNVAILKGIIYFHLNPRLCYEKIVKLQSMIKSAEQITVVDVSPNSNGERVICGYSVRVLNATVEDFNSTAVRIAVGLMSSDDIDILIGYSYHYKEAKFQNVTMYDGRHGCGHDKCVSNTRL